MQANCVSYCCHKTGICEKDDICSEYFGSRKNFLLKEKCQILSVDLTRLLD